MLPGIQWKPSTACAHSRKMCCHLHRRHRSMQVQHPKPTPHGLLIYKTRTLQACQHQVGRDRRAQAPAADRKVELHNQISLNRMAVPEQEHSNRMRNRMAVPEQEHSNRMAVPEQEHSNRMRERVPRGLRAAVIGVFAQHSQIIEPNNIVVFSFVEPVGMALLCAIRPQKRCYILCNILHNCWLQGW